MTNRGDIVLVALGGDYGKPRPVLIVQSDLVADLPSVVACPLTTMVRSELSELRLTVLPTSGNGLREMSHDRQTGDNTQVQVARYDWHA